MITERYRSPSYRPALVHKRYVRATIRQDSRYSPFMTFRVFECARLCSNGNRTKALLRIGAGPTIREYDCTAADLPLPLVNMIGVSSDVFEWKD